MKITLIDSDGSARILDAQVGDSLMQAALNGGVRGIVGECGGSCSCATCHVYIEPPWNRASGEPGSLEKEMLELTQGPSAYSRLACQVILNPSHAGLVARVAKNDA